MLTFFFIIFIFYVNKLGIREKKFKNLFSFIQLKLSQKGKREWHRERKREGTNKTFQLINEMEL